MNPNTLLILARAWLAKGCPSFLFDRIEFIAYSRRRVKDKGGRHQRLPVEEALPWIISTTSGGLNCEFARDRP
jgi:hypothetical protein